MGHKYNKAPRELSSKRNEIIRPLTYLEWYYGLMSYRGLIGSVTVTARYAKPMTKPEVIRAVKSVIIKNPWLLANVFTDNIRGEPTDCVWKYAEKIDLNDVVQFINVKNGQEEDPKSPLSSKLVTDMLHRSFLWSDMNKTDKVLWKIIVLNDVELCLVYDHGLLDGKSGQSFQMSIFETLREFENIPLEDNMVTTVGQSDLPEDVPHINDPDCMLHYKGALSYLLFAALLPMIPNMFRPRRLRYKPAPPPIPKSEQAKGIPEQIEFEKAKVELLHLTTEETQNIIKACKQHNSTVTAFVNIAGIDVISRVTGINKIRHQTPIDARKCISPSNPTLRGTDKKRVLGFFTSIFDSYYDRKSKRTFWQKVIEHTNEIKSKTTDDFIYTSTLPCLVKSPLFPGTYKFLDQVATQKRDYTMWLSNLGYVKLDYKEESKFNVERMNFMFAGAFNAVIVDCITTNNNGSPVMSLYFHDGPNSLKNRSDLTKIKELVKEMITDPEVLMLDSSESISKKSATSTQQEILSKASS